LTIFAAEHCITTPDHQHNEGISSNTNMKSEIDNVALLENAQRRILMKENNQGKWSSV